MLRRPRGNIYLFLFPGGLLFTGLGYNIFFINKDIYIYIYVPEELADSRKSLEGSSNGKNVFLKVRSGTVCGIRAESEPDLSWVGPGSEPGTGSAPDPRQTIWTPMNGVLECWRCLGVCLHVSSLNHPQHPFQNPFQNPTENLTRIPA